MAWSILSPPVRTDWAATVSPRLIRGHLGRATADVADHAGGGLGDGQADADHRGLGFGHDPHLAGPCAVERC